MNLFLLSAKVSLRRHKWQVGCRVGRQCAHRTVNTAWCTSQYYQWLLPRPQASDWHRGRVRLRRLATFAQTTCSSWNVWRAGFTLNTCFTILKLWYKEVVNVGFCFLEIVDSVRYQRLTVKLKISVHNSNLDLFQTLEISPWVLNWKLFWRKRQKTPEHRKNWSFFVYYGVVGTLIL